MRAQNGKGSADLVEFLGYSGCRLAEVVGDAHQSEVPLIWGGVDFDLKTFTVTGKGRGDEGKTRTVPMFPPLERLLLTFKARLSKASKLTDPIFGIASAITSIGHACKKLELPKYNHHIMRHFFCSNCFEAGVDFKVMDPSGNSEKMKGDDENVRLVQTRGYNRHMKVYKSPQAFRYLVDANHSRIVTSPDRIDLRNLKNVMGRTANFLDDTSSAIGEMNLDSE